MSGFTSIKAVAKHLAGSFAGAFVKERFKNKRFMPCVKCPTLFLHGKRDNVVPYQHSVELHGAFCLQFLILIELVTMREKALHLSEEMDHTEYDYFEDIGAPISSFLKEYNILNIRNIVTSEIPNFEAFRKPNPDLLMKG